MKKRKYIALITVLTLALTGCQGNKTEIEKEVETSTGADEEMTAVTEPESGQEPDTGEISADPENPNQYYNVSAKYHDGYTYVASGKGLYRIADTDSEKELLYEGSVNMGVMTDRYLLFYSFPSDMTKAAIMAYDLSSGDMIESNLLGEDIYLYHEMRYADGKVYINMGESIGTFTLQQDGTLQKVDTQEISTALPDNTHTEENTGKLSEIIAGDAGINQDLYVVYTQEGASYDKLYMYDGDTLVSTIDGITDITITPRGFIGRDVSQQKDIYLWSLEGEKICQLYASKDHEDAYAGYNTYDNEGIYGIQQKSETDYDIIQISWDGALRTLFSIKDTSSHVGVDLRMSVVDHWLYYCNPETGNMERRNLGNIDEVEIIDDAAKVHK